MYAAFFSSDPLCPVCSNLPDDTADAAEVSLQPSLKVSTETYRRRSIHELNTFLTRDYLDYRVGMLNGKMQHSLLPFADVIINMPLMFGNEGVAGRTHSFAVSEATAILEGLERYCGMSPRGKTNVHGSFHDLEEHALNPSHSVYIPMNIIIVMVFHLNRLILIMSKTGYGDILYHKTDRF